MSKKECRNCESSKYYTLTTCKFCSAEGCSECVSYICSDCSVECCNDCHTADDYTHCDCYGKCSSCGIEVNRGENGWPCCECREWYCDKCRRKTNCKECKCVSENDSETEK